MIETHASLAEKFLKKWVWLYIFGYIIAPIGYIVKIFISGEVSVSELGILYWIISLITLLSAFSDLWVWESLKYFLPKYIADKKYAELKSVLCYSYIIQIISGLILTVLFLFWADFLAQNYFKNPLAKDSIQVFSLFFLGINVFNILSQFFLAVQNTLYYKLVEFIRNIFLLISVWSFLFLDISQLHLFASSWVLALYGWLIVAIFLFYRKYYCPYLQGEKIIWSKELAKNFFSYALVVFLSAQIWVLLSQVDMQMVIYLLSTTDAGYYSVYLSLITIPFLIIGPIFSLLLPVFSELSAKKSQTSIQKLKSSLSNTMILTGMFFSAFLFSFSEAIAFTLFWETFLSSGLILQYSCLFLIFNFLLQINFNILGWEWRVGTKLKITSLWLIINIILNIIFLQSLWVAGAALATGIWWFIIFILSEISLKNNYTTKYNFLALFYNFILLSVLGSVSYSIWHNTLEWISRFSTLFFIFVFGLIWVLFFIVLNRAYLRAFIYEIKKLRNA